MEQEVRTTHKQQTFLKTLANHIVKTVVATILVAVLGGIGTSFVFYYEANNAISNLMINDFKQDKSLEVVNQTTQEINQKLNYSDVNNAVLNTEIKEFKTQMGRVHEKQEDMQKTQMEILKILGEINRRSKN
ncbi:hypothetical protein COY27_07165 [Candidatus Woesearchaeota archaeon CG_4_10_14_0_2_um_filter_33_13]|nr:MAG: hypothetical protein COY27_07165 [Candidatus Woesearchaeota archaeon CG_4_10_14_0_2_um_filter_33_13]